MDMLSYEYELWNKGYQLISGIDEVGRGCLFGDVVAAAVILPKQLKIDGIQDSKKLNQNKREYYYNKILEKAISIGIGIVDVETINNLNIKQASRYAMKIAVEKLHIQPDVLIIDAESIECQLPQLSIIHGDSLSQSVAAASIIAKVSRDIMCNDWDKQYPEYGIKQHKGYGTKYHRDRIIQLGVTPLHRKLFLRKLL